LVVKNSDQQKKIFSAVGHQLGSFLGGFSLEPSRTETSLQTVRSTREASAKAVQFKVPEVRG
jgi:hypothetical protein